MLIYFIYKNNSYNFTVKNDITISYLKDLVSKMIQKDKACFDLFYNNKILSENDSSLYKITKKENKVPIIISLKKNNTNNSMVKLPLLTMPNKTNKNMIDLEPKINLNLNETEISTDSFLKDININQNTKSLTKRKNGNKIPQKEYISRNKVFEDIYNLKDEQIISLMKNLGNKILEYDDALYKKFKTSFNKNNSQLLLYEKNIINFKDKQIQFFQKLINYFDNVETAFSKYKINLEEFYSELSNYSNNKNSNSFVLNESTKKEKKIVISKNRKFSEYSDKKLPNISIIKSAEDNLHLNNKISESSDYSDEILKEKIDTILDNKKPKNINKEKKKPNISKSSKINLAKINEYKEFKEFKENNTPKKKTEYKSNKNLTKEKDIIININEENVKNSQNNFKKIENNKININNINNNKINNNNAINNNINNNNKNYKSLMIKSQESEERFEMENLDKNKINVLFEISESNHENTGNNSHSSNSKNNSSNNSKEKKKLARFKRKGTLNFNQMKNQYFNFQQTKDKKATHRLKKLGTNVFDFII